MHAAQRLPSCETAPGLPFLKMHSLGNDFVILEADKLEPAFVQKLADRRLGLGCDQVLTMTPSAQPDVHANVLIYNADGGEAEACGNGTRCVMAELARRYGVSTLKVQTAAGLLTGTLMGENEVEVAQGHPTFLSEDPLDLSDFGLDEGYAVNLGNPHLVVPVQAIDPERFTRMGARLSAHGVFPHKANVAFIDTTPDNVRVWMWERGAGHTLACASGTSAAVWAMIQADMLKAGSHPVKVDAGTMWVTWKPGEPVRHRAHVTHVARGTLGTP